MTNEAILDEQLDIWRRKLTEHKAALEQAGALAVAGDTAQAARLITDATTGAAIAQSAIEALEARREAAQASDLLAKADRLEAMAAELDAQAAPIYAQVDALIDQASQLGVTLVRRGIQRDADMRSQAGGNVGRYLQQRDISRSTYYDNVKRHGLSGKAGQEPDTKPDTWTLE